MDDLDQDDSVEQPENSRVPVQLRPWAYKKGQTGNPHGRPKGVSMKEYVRNKLLTLTESEREEFLDSLPKKDIWEMAEGKPDGKTDLTSGGEKILTVDPQLLDRAAALLAQEIKDANRTE